MRHLLAAAGCALLGAAHAGHEFPFYPSFYPQEITVEALDARAAAQRLAQGTLHAYVGAAPAANPAKTGSAASLGGYLVAKGGACAPARGAAPALGEDAVWHPYPVTPFHADYLHHADRAAGAAAQGPQRSGPFEIVDAGELLAAAATRYNGWSGPPWLRQGWFHAYLLLAPAARDARIEQALRRLVRGEPSGPVERAALERELVALLQRRCERAVLGYTVRRERYAIDYSKGVENVGHDALAGLAAPIFPRTVKLRDFPWNGWLNVAAPAPPAGAWNPVVGGFDDAFGRLVWSALADPAFLASPHGAGWIENRLSAGVEAGAPRAVPADALFAPARGATATARVLYRVRNSSFHDGTPMAVADLLYAYAFATAWGEGGSADPAVARATALARERLKGVRPLRVETETLAFGEDKLTYEVPVIEVYLDAAAEDAAVIAPPWTTLPWHLLALFDQAARRGLLKLSAFDPVRDRALVDGLAELARDLEARAYIPPALAAHASAADASARYRRLRAFHAAHGHWLVTNGPYRLERWDGSKAVLGAFRDPSYPKGLGSFNAYAVPLRAHATRIERDGRAALVHTEAEWLERLGRDVRVVRGSFAQRLAERLAGAGPLPLPVCHYLLVAPDGSVAAAGAVRAGDKGVCRLELPAAARPARAGRRLVVAPVLEDNRANASIKIVPWGD